ncbi:hypothetical protein DLAC_05112 [Tieghemostelium lacteum]|uniref:RNA helicase n=1 Tax=Tieghemostelium lacteum TaxID=361077 RepID=A0A151ZID1_TIELA|nr:hypothetical protein DLAC_05112 [Tieghemostelium lacteum]|eukprot:KYQ93723.1 hypothetical protein DLAC_05112 [Tieghemostelium lacteum]
MSSKKKVIGKSGKGNNKKKTIVARTPVDPLKELQNAKKERKVVIKKRKVQINENRLEDVDDITLEEYKQSEINTLKRVRDHVFEGGDEFDNFDILGENGDFEEEPVFEFTQSDIASTEILNDEQIYQLRKKHKSSNIIPKDDFIDNTQVNEEDEEDEKSKQEQQNKTKMSKKEKERLAIEKKLLEARKIQFALLQPFKKSFWKDSLQKLTEDDHRNMRIKLKAKVELCVGSNRKVPRPVLDFEDDDLPESMRDYLQFIQNKNPDITTPTPVQSQAWSCIMTGSDVLTIAQTGSGKTLGYLLPSIPHILAQQKYRQTQLLKKKKSTSQISKQGPVVLIIVPTRELAKQVESSCKPLRSKFNIHSLAVYGGVDAQEQKEILGQEHNEIVIATPGRLVDLINNSKEVIGLLGSVTMLIFDEADRMLQLGFGDQLHKISQQIRPDRQTLMFSATFPQPMQEAAKKWLNQSDHMKIRVKSSTVNQESTAIVSKNVKQVIKVIKDSERFKHLSSFLKSIMEKEAAMRNKSLILIFVNQIKFVKPLLNQIEKLLHSEKKIKIRAGSIHGDMKQFERDQMVNEFKSGKISILVATDILGRGIHINNLRFVVNYDFPTSLEQYIHRVGRTGRQGNKGHSLTYFSDSISNKAMSKGLIKILQECNQQVSKELQELSDSYHGESMETPNLFESSGTLEDDDQDEELNDIKEEKEDDEDYLQGEETSDEEEYLQNENDSD